MKIINEKTINVGNKELSFSLPIKNCIKYENYFVVLIRDKKEVPNNVIAYDYDGNELWKINDIVQNKILRGYDMIVKKSDRIMEAYYELGIIYEIDVEEKKVINKLFLR